LGRKPFRKVFLGNKYTPGGTLPAPPQTSSTRLIAIDMDGTLLGDDGRVSPRNLAALHAAHAAGIEIVVATGRRHSYAMRVLRPLGLHHACVLVSSNGAVTRTLGSTADRSQLIACTHLPRATALWLCGYLDEFRDALVLTFDRVGPDGDDTRGALVVEHLDELNSSIGRWMAANQPYIAHVVPIERALTPDAGADPTAPNHHAPIQAMLCGTVERMARAEARLLEQPGVSASGHPSGRSGKTMGAPHLDSEMWESSHKASGAPVGVTFVTAPPSRMGSDQPADTPILTLNRTEYPDRDLSILDILPAGCSKGAAVLSLAAARAIDASQVLAIGDNWNDVSMLEIAGAAVLMDNAPPDLKALARTRGWRLGPSNQNDGVADAIEAALAVAC
jgi:hydroxymethylpyrimidine pyrophosphatase-like HAD family hydrolase